MNSSNLIVKTFPVGAFQCNCTIVADIESGTAIVVDPGDEAPLILGELHKVGVKATHLIHTHAHIDHIMATKEVKTATGATIGLHRDDLFLYDNIAMQGEFLGLRGKAEVSPVDHYLEHGDVIDFTKDHRLEVLHTPGHTPGSLCFLLHGKQNLLFAGDTLFLGSIGRTDLWGGDYGQIIDSIKTKLLTLDGHTPVVCGHGPNTSIGQEKKSNPFLGND